MSQAVPVFRALRAALLLAAGLVTAPAMANTCQRIETELASLSRGAVPARDARLANRYRAEAQRIAGEMAALNCQRPRLFIFGESAPQCAGLRQRHAQMMAGSAYYGGGEAKAWDDRRRQLMAALVSNNCHGRAEPQQAARRGTLTAGIFDEDNPARRREIEIGDDEDEPRPATRRPLPAAGKAVCVRMCDGYFFPLASSRGRAREDGDEICQSLCPASETRVFFLGSREIDRAVGSEGQTYQSLTNAYRYRQSFDPTCGCRKPGETWAEALRNAEDQTRLRAGDIVVPGDSAMTVIGGKAVTAEARLRGVEPAGPPAPEAAPAPESDVGAAAIPLVEGEMREFTGRDGVKRTVRVVSPGPSTAP
jgi:hypothetical protein